MALTDNLVSYWKLDESSGNAADSVGSNTGTNSNVTYNTGKINNGAVFNGSSSRLTLSALSTGTNNTYSAWVKRSGNGSGEMIIANLSGGTGKKGTTIRTNGGATWQYLNSNFSAWVNIATNFQDNTRYHIVIVQNGSGTQSYVNGSAAGSDAQTGANSNTSSAIGSNSSAQDYFNGMVDEVGFWDRALTSTEITSLYNSGNGLQYPFSTGVAFTPKIIQF